MEEDSGAKLWEGSPGEQTWKRRPWGENSERTSDQLEKLGGIYTILISNDHHTLSASKYIRSNASVGIRRGLTVPYMIGEYLEDHYHCRG